MNILIVTDLYPISNNDNIPFVIEDFALAIKEYGNNVDVFRPNFLLNTLIRKHKIYFPKIYTRNDIEIYNKNFILPFIFYKFNIKKKYDIIISHMPSGHIFSSLINKKLKLPHIAICHQSDYDVLNKKTYSFYFKNRLQKALKSSTVIGARNAFLKKELNAEFVLPSFIDKEYILDKKNPDFKKLKLITLSKLIKRKNINLVIEALRRANFDFEYSIYGDGEEKNNLNNLIKKYHLENKIKLYGKIPHNEIYHKLDKNNVFILPSDNETFGISYLEAMARGLVTIGRKNTGIDGIIKNNINGYLVENTSESILDVLNQINKYTQDDIIKNTLLTAKKYQKQAVMDFYMNIIKNYNKKYLP